MKNMLEIGDIKELSSKVNWEKEWMNGMIPVIAQDINTKEILMQAFANREAFENTLKTWNATYYSRSRDELWEKWLTSGATQKVYDIKIDCDGDSIIYMIEQLWNVGACHIDGQNSCFDTDIINLKEYARKNIWDVLASLFVTLNQRKTDFDSWIIWPESSYTVKLMSKWVDAILKKVTEEAWEVVLWAKNNDRENVIYEISDLYYMVSVLMVYSWIDLSDIAWELNRRFWVSGIVEKNSREK